jgi:WD40 repeat protein
MKAIGWSVLIVGACSVAWPAQVGAQGAPATDLPRGAVRRPGSQNLRHDSALSAAFTPDGSILITAGRDIRLWDARTRRLVRTIPLEDGYLRQMHVTADVKMLYAFPDTRGCVLAFDIASGKQLTPLAAKERDLMLG